MLSPSFISAWTGVQFRLRKSYGECEKRQASHNATSIAFRIPSRCALSALLFDCDGVLAESERDGHRVAFNEAFRDAGLSCTWDVQLYGKLLAIGGGKERMTSYFNSVGWPERPELNTQSARTSFIQSLHISKTNLFLKLVSEGRVPLRPGVEALIKAALNSGIKVCVCSTSNERAVRGIVALLGDEIAGRMRVFAGDAVKKKKPAPDIYLLAAKELDLEKNEVCVIEDSYIGLAAAKAADMKCIVTKSSYTVHEDFSTADLVVDSLEDSRTALAEIQRLVAAAPVASE